MPYNINYTDRDTKLPITVYDNTLNTDTSLKFPGRNYTGYGQVMGENLLALLENFASPSPPVNATEGQLWYDSSTGTLQINDGTGVNGWKAASGVQKSPVPPTVSADKVGEVWVDTVKQQLYVWSGSTWVLVGPEFSSETGLRTGPIIETITDSDNRTRKIVKFLVDDVPVAIVSKDSFTPKITIPGFDLIRAGMNIAEPGDAAESAAFLGGFLPKITGTATSADSLTIGNVTVESGKFLRTDAVNTTEFGLNIRNNSGLTLGVDGTFRLSSSVTANRIYNATPGSSIDLQTNQDGTANTVLRVIENRVGINVLSPENELDVVGTVSINGNLTISNTDLSTNFNNGSITTAGGVAIQKNLLIGQGISVQGGTVVEGVIPRNDLIHDLGSPVNRWNTIYAQSISAVSLEGTLQGDINGNAGTATRLRQTSRIKLSGQVESEFIDFDGSTGGLEKILQTEISPSFIADQDEPFPNVSTQNDTILVFRAGTGLLKQKRNVFIADLGIPIGTILPFAGVNVPEGFLLCDGSEVEIDKYTDLFNVIGNFYGTPSIGIRTFLLPDLRGRFAMGRDNMDNQERVQIAGGGFALGGGGNVDRVAGVQADQLGGSGGQSVQTLSVTNLPDHVHDLRPTRTSTRRFNVVRLDTTPVPGIAPGTGLGPSVPNAAQYMNNTGGVDSATLGAPFAVQNPFLTINYIIRSGPPNYERDI